MHKKICLFSAIAMLVLGACGGTSDAQNADDQVAAAADSDSSDVEGGDMAFDNDDQRTIYAIGLILAQQAGGQLGGLYLDDAEQEVVLQGFRDGLLGNDPKVDVQEYGPKIQPMMQARSAAASTKEKEAAGAFLEEMRGTEGAEIAESGLIYVELEPGSGASPAATDRVKVHYHGTLRDGSVFDSSVDRGEPITLGLNQVIPCWTEGMQKMKVGGKSKLICPSDIAYGDQGRPPTIPGGAPLVFEVELIEIVSGTS